MLVLPDKAPGVSGRGDARPFWGRGYASEASTALAFGFEALCLPEIVSYTSVNVRSQRVLRRVGMVHDPGGGFRPSQASRAPPAAGAGRDEVVAAIQALEGRTGAGIFTVRDVYAEMVAAGTRYVKSTAFKTMQRMKAPPERPSFIPLEKAGCEGFRLTLGF